jgi:hypothetical protein
MTTHKIFLSEALRVLESGQSPSGFSIDFDKIEVEASNNSSARRCKLRFSWHPETSQD